MKKILFITRSIAPPWDEASKNFAYTLAKSIMLLSPSPSGGRVRDGGVAPSQNHLELHLMTKGKLENLPKNIIQENIYTSNNFNFWQKLRLLIFLIFNARKFDIIHLLFTPTKLNSSFIKYFVRNKKTKIIQTIATLRDDLFSKNEIKNMLFGNLIITYSDCAKNRLEKMEIKKIKKIYPGIDLDYYSPAPKNFRFLMNNDLRLEDFIITYPGEYSRLGAIDDIMEAIVRLSSSPSIKFVLACRVKNKKDVKKKEKVIKKLKKLNLLNKVVFIDTAPDMAKLYNSSDVIIFPARDMKGKFDVPLAVIEPMACGKPVIISDIPIFREFANDKNSVIINPASADQLSKSILDLCQNKNKREAIGKTARKYAEENFDIKKIAGEYRRIYEGL